MADNVLYILQYILVYRLAYSSSHSTWRQQRVNLSGLFLFYVPCVLKFTFYMAAAAGQSLLCTMLAAPPFCSPMKDENTMLFRM